LRGVVGCARLCVLLRCLALGGPGVDNGDFVLEGGVNEAMALERVEALELRRDDDRVEGLATAAYDIVMLALSEFTP
jgi:hypothetical protein